MRRGALLKEAQFICRLPTSVGGGENADGNWSLMAGFCGPGSLMLRGFLRDEIRVRLPRLTLTGVRTEELGDGLVKEIRLEPDEAAVLSLAARVWRQAELAGAAAGAVPANAGGSDVRDGPQGTAGRPGCVGGAACGVRDGGSGGGGVSPSASAAR